MNGTFLSLDVTENRSQPDQLNESGTIPGLLSVG
jgi:hypothetical protein